MTGFESGLKNWNSIHSNILRANQGAKQLEQGEKRLKLENRRVTTAEKLAEPVTAAHEAKKAAGGYKHKAEVDKAMDMASLRKQQQDNLAGRINLPLDVAKKVGGLIEGATDYVRGFSREVREKESHSSKIDESKANVDKIRFEIELKKKQEEKQGKLLKSYRKDAASIHKILSDPDSTFTEKLDAERQIGELSAKYAGIIGGTGSGGKIGMGTHLGLGALAESFRESKEYELNKAADSKRLTDAAALKSQLDSNAPAKAQYDGLRETVEHARQMSRQPGAEGLKWKQIELDTMADLQEYTYKTEAMGLVEAAKVDPSAIFNPERGIIHYDEGAVYAHPETGEPYVNSVTGEPLRRRVMNWGITKPRLIAALAEEERKGKTVTTFTEGVGGLPGFSKTTTKPTGEPLTKEQQADQLLLGAAGGRGPTESITTQTRQPTETTQAHGEPMFPGSTKTMQDFWNVDDLMERHAAGGDRAGGAMPKSAYSEMMRREGIFASAEGAAQEKAAVDASVPDRDKPIGPKTEPPDRYETKQKAKTEAAGIDETSMGHMRRYIGGSKRELDRMTPIQITKKYRDKQQKDAEKSADKVSDMVYQLVPGMSPAGKEGGGLDTMRMVDSVANAIRKFDKFDNILPHELGTITVYSKDGKHKEIIDVNWPRDVETINKLRPLLEDIGKVKNNIKWADGILREGKPSDEDLGWWKKQLQKSANEKELKRKGEEMERNIARAAEFQRAARSIDEIKRKLSDSSLTVTERMELNKELGKLFQSWDDLIQRTEKNK